MGRLEEEKGMAVQALIVEDSRIGRSVLKLHLEKAGFEVVAEAGNASEGRELFQRLHPQLVTLDLLMPQVGEMDAKSLFHLIRKEAPGVAVVVISAHPLGTERAQYLRNGALAYFEKPLNFRSLIAKLEQLFPHRGAAADHRQTAA
jgi:two-component system, chemotaxis family, chemotaxis protein CheY